MADLVELGTRGVLMGVAGAELMDVWSAVVRRRFGIPTLDDRLLGLWIGHMPRGRFVHSRIAASPPVRGERALGWLAHYAIGVMFAFWSQAGPPITTRRTASRSRLRALVASESAGNQLNGGVSR